MSSLVETAVQKPLLPSRREVATRIFRHRTVFLICFLLVVIGFAVTGQFAKKYQAHMEILVRKERVDSVLTAVQNSTPDLQQLSVSEEELNSEVEILKSEDLLHDVVLKAELAPSGAASQVAAARAVARLERTLDVSAIPKTNIINIKYEDAHADRAARVLATLGTLYLRKHQQLHGSTYEVSFLSDQVEQHQRALNAAEAGLLAFTRKTGVVSAALERDLTIQQIKNITQQRMEAEAAAADALGRSRTMTGELSKTAPRITTAAKRADNPALLQQVKTTLLNLQLHRADLLATYDPSYRLVKDTDVAIEVTQKMLDAQADAPIAEWTTDINPVATSLQQELVRSQAELSGLNAKQMDLGELAAKLQGEATNLQAKNIDQERLARTVKTEQDEYQLYMEKREQARMAAALDREGILNVIVAAAPYTPLLPEHSPLLALAAALFTGATLSLGAAFVADIFDPTVRSATELEELLAIPLLEEFGQDIYMKRGSAWL